MKKENGLRVYQTHEGFRIGRLNDKIGHKQPYTGSDIEREEKIESVNGYAIFLSIAVVLAELCLFIFIIFHPAKAASYNFGDSISFGVAATAPQYDYVQTLDVALGITSTNLAVSGAQAADQAIVAHGRVLAAADQATLMIGTNDSYRTSPYYQQFLTDILVQLAAPARATGRNGGITFTGSWAQSQPTWATGSTTFTAGDKATATVSGTAVYISVIKQDDYNGTPVGGTADVYIDGAKVGSVTTLGTGMTTYNGAAYAPGTYRFAGLGAGAHAVQVICTSAVSGVGGVFYLEAITGSAQTILPSIFVSNILNFSPSGYSTFGGSLANTATLNGVVTGTVNALAADGLKLTSVDSNSVVNTTTDLSSDGVHPVNSGHAKIEGAFYSAMTGPPPPPPTYVPAYLCTNGIGYFGAEDLGCSINLQPL